MEFRILGPVEVRAHGRVVALGGTKPRALLAALLLDRNRAVSVERLAQALWGEDAPAGAVKTVQVHVSRLRKALGDPERLTTTPAGYRLQVQPGELDLERFERLVGEGRRAIAAGRPGDGAAALREALALWRGPPIADLVSLPFAPREIARLEEQRLAAVEACIDADLAAGRHGQLIAELEQLTNAHPWRERLHAQLMIALYRGGRQAEALEVYRQARDVLVEQLGVEPSTELRALHQAVLAHDPTLDAYPRPVPVAADGHGALPVPPTALFGRESALADLTDLVRERRARAVTLVGPGGVGKTRLAVEAVRDLAEDFAHGACFVELAAVAESEELASAIARALNAPASEGEPAKATLQRFLRDRELLLLLDNFEHLMDGARMVAELVATCPHVTFLVTSREPLRLGAERIYPVRPLDLPAPDSAVSVSELERYSAVAVFCDRARARDIAFTLDAESAPHVREICRRLDGLPLALELAAARIGLLTTAELAGRLGRALVVLSAGARDAPERHRTLRATIDWSFGLLTDSEGETFARMAVFAGGATVTDAEAVTGASLDELDSLVAKHLLVRRGERVLMLETVREYALERLADDANADALYERFAQWSLGFLRDATRRLANADPGGWMRRVDAELPNALAALSWTLEKRRAELALQLAAELGEYWWRSNRWRDGLRWLDLALDQGDEASDHAHANALLYRARLHGVRRYIRDRTDLERALALFRSCEDLGGAAACIGHLAVAEAWIGRYEEARALSDEAVRSAEAAHDEWALAQALAVSVLVSADYEDAVSHARTATAYLARVGSLFDLSLSCNVTGYLGIIDGRYEDALTWLDQGLDAARRLGSLHGMYLILGNQGLARLYLDQLDEAEDAFSSALAICRDAGDEALVDETLLGSAVVALRRGDLRRAAHLVGAARAHATAEVNLDEKAMAARLIGEILPAGPERYGAENWNRAEQEGATLTVQEAIGLARAGT